MANKKFFTKEVKIGVSFVVALALLFWGLNFLKGVNLFTPTNHYCLQYENLDGLVVSNGVFIKGYKVGQVRDIKYDFTQSKPFTIDIMINSDISLPKGTVAYLFDESMMGGKGINLVFTDCDIKHSSGDTLTCDVQPGLFASIGEIIPSLQSTIGHADSLLASAGKIVSSPALSNSLSNFESITAELHSTAHSLNYLIDQQFPPIVSNVSDICNDLKSITGQLKGVRYGDILQSVDSTMNNLQLLTERLNSPDGSLGLLLNDNNLYMNVNSTVKSANNLLMDLKENPKRYVHFSLWGAKEKKQKNKKH